MTDKNKIFLFIIWEFALDESEKIINDIGNHFNILNIYNFEWAKRKILNNVKRFYEIGNKEAKGKIKVCGCSSFKLIIIKDDNPRYEKRVTSKGEQNVNANIFDLKQKYRSWTGNDHKIHSSNNVFETNHDMVLLLGKNVDDYIKSRKCGKNEINISKDLIGENKWDNIEQLFYVLNSCFKYVVLRDFENNLQESLINDSYDIDILCEKSNSFKYLVNTRSNKAVCGDKVVRFDVKDCNSNYYCKKMSNDLLNNRVKKAFFYVPNKNYYYYSLLYHALIHKDNFENEYNLRLSYLFKDHDIEKNKDYYIEKLEKWMIKNNYHISLNKKMNYKNIETTSYDLLDKRVKKTLNIVSIIVPVYNVENYVSKCIESIINQTYEKIEIIIVDDESTDNSLKICKKYSALDKRIRIISKKHSGLGYTRNVGIKAATGKYLMFVDSDDWIENNTVEELMLCMKEEKYDAVFFDLKYYDQKKDKYIVLDENKQYIGDTKFVIKKLDNCMTPAICCAIYDSKWYKKNIPNFPNCVYEDSSIYPVILLKLTKYKIVSKEYYIYRINTGKSLSQNYENNLNRIASLRYALKFVKSINNWEIYKKHIYNFCINRKNKALKIIGEHYDKEVYEKIEKEYEEFFKGFNN